MVICARATAAFAPKRLVSIGRSGTCRAGVRDRQIACRAPTLSGSRLPLKALGLCANTLEDGLGHVVREIGRNLQCDGGDGRLHAGEQFGQDVLGVRTPAAPGRHGVEVMSQDGGLPIVPVLAADGHGEPGIAPCQRAFPVADDGPGRDHVVHGGERIGAPGLQTDTEVIGAAVCGCQQATVVGNMPAATLSATRDEAFRSGSAVDLTLCAQMAHTCRAK